MSNDEHQNGLDRRFSRTNLLADLGKGVVTVVAITLTLVAADWEIVESSIGWLVAGGVGIVFAAGTVWALWPFTETAGPPLLRMWHRSTVLLFFAALLLLAVGVYDWTSSAPNSSRSVAFQFWWNLADTVPLGDVAETLNLEEPLPEYPFGVSAVFLTARAALAGVVLAAIGQEWALHKDGLWATGRNAEPGQE